MSLKILRLNRFFLKIAVLTSHLGLLALLVYGTWEQILASVGVYFLMGCVGMSVGYHRLLSHRSFKTLKIVEYFTSLCGVVGLVGSPISWVAVHREHHNFTDTDQDPHSPHKKGFVFAHFLSMSYKPKLIYARRLIKDPVQIFFHKHYFGINLAYGALLYFFVQPFAVVYLWLAPAAILWHGGSSINSFCHMFGYRNFQIRNSARNNPVFALLTWGEGWHNNHHRYPVRSSYQVKWWELDIGGMVAWLLKTRRSAR